MYSIHIPFEEESLFTEADLGRGLSIDELEGSCKKKHVYSCEKNNIITTYPLRDTNNLSIVRDQETLKSELNLCEFGLPFGIISGKVLGRYYDPSEICAGTEKLTLLYRRKVISKVVELNPDSKLLDDVELEVDIDSLRSSFGLFYIKKIEYGAVLNIKITLESCDRELIRKLKSELEGSIDISKLSSTITPDIKNSINISSSVFMGGCKQVHRSDIQSLSDAIVIINSFEVDMDRLVPVNIEISPIPIQSAIPHTHKQIIHQSSHKHTHISHHPS